MTCYKCDVCGKEMTEFTPNAIDINMRFQTYPVYVCVNVEAGDSGMDVCRACLRDALGRAMAVMDEGTA